MWLAKYESRHRQRGESIASLADDLRQLAQRAYSDLDVHSQERLALNMLYKQDHNGNKGFLIPFLCYPLYTMLIVMDINCFMFQYSCCF